MLTLKEIKEMNSATLLHKLETTVIAMTHEVNSNRGNVTKRTEQNYMRVLNGLYRRL